MIYWNWPYVREVMTYEAKFLCFCEVCSSSLNRSQFRLRSVLCRAKRSSLFYFWLLLRIVFALSFCDGWREGCWFFVKLRFLKGKVSALLGEGQSERQVSRKVGVPKSAVHRWRANAFSLYRKVGSDWRRMTSSESDRLIESMSSRTRQVMVGWQVMAGTVLWGH